MLSFIPELRIARLPDAPRLTPKLGGLPVGLAIDRWPSCAMCHHPMTLLAQIPLEQRLLTLTPLAGRADLDVVLHLFKCEQPSSCDHWDAHSGANAAFLVPRGELAQDHTIPDQMRQTVLPEIWIAEWREHNDAVTPEMLPAFYVERELWKLPEEIGRPHWSDRRIATKLGGPPYWTGNGPCEPPPPPYGYFMQIDQFLVVPDNPEGDVDFANFCSDGILYVFIDPTSPPALPKCLMYINR